MTAEQERTAESSLLEAVLEQLPLGVIITDAQGNVTRANRYAREVIGPHLASVGVTFGARGGLRRSDGSPVKASEEPLGRALRKGAPVVERVEWEAEPGAYRSFVTSATPVRDESGRVTAAVVVFEDVTERERREQAERDFVTNAAHELRTPLAAIAGAVEVLQAGAKELPEQRDLFLAHIERESWRLGRLARALLLLARAQTGVEQPKLEIVPLRPLLQSVAQGIRPAPGVTLSVRCRRTVAALSNADLLEQALLNLAGNAARYTTAGEISLVARVQRTQAVVEIRDTGQGLSRVAHRLAFDRFYRDDPARDADGFGLGLAIARQAVESVGGAIELESEEGSGTVARIRLPLAKLISA